jgi:peptidoglycan/xylan/chitin deacetylase (PgdA/CDA1 family)
MATALIELGSHTVSHPVLSSLPAAAQQAEILGSKQRLESLIGREVSSFAYPYGSRADYTKTTTAIVRDSGFRLACANVPEGVSSSGDRLQLPRFLVRNWDGDEFERHLDTWSAGA